MLDELSVKEQLFVNAYLGEALGNGTKSARIAGYQGDDSTLAVQAVKLLRKAKITGAIQSELDKRKVTSENVLAELASIAFNKFEKASDRNKSLELLGKYLKLFSDNIMHSGEVNLNHAVTFEDWKAKADERLKEVLESE
jgi:phage terminase small subunit